MHGFIPILFAQKAISLVMLRMGKMFCKRFKLKEYENIFSYRNFDFLLKTCPKNHDSGCPYDIDTANLPSLLPLSKALLQETLTRPGNKGQAKRYPSRLAFEIHARSSSYVQ